MSVRDGARDAHLDALRGTAMLLVVLGHAIQRQAPPTDPVFWDGVQRFIGTIDMPLFALVAGYVTFGRVGGSEWKWLGGKALRLLVPYFAWGLVLFYLGDLRYVDTMPQYMLLLTRYPVIGLWFLYTLFLIYVLLVVALKLGDRIGQLAGLAVVGILLLLVPIDSCGVWQAQWYYWPFAAGYLVARYRDRLAPLLPAARAIALPAFAGAFWWAMRIPAGEWYLNPETLPRATVSLRGAAIVLACVLVASSGMLLAEAMVASWRGSAVHRLLARVGCVSLGVYGAHLMFLHLPVVHGARAVLATFMAASALSVLLCLLLRRSWFYSAVFLGEWPKATRERVTSVAGIN